MRRREFIAGLGGAAAWPVTARTQRPAMPVIGFLGTTTPEEVRVLLAAFHRGLAETGFIEGRNMAIEYRWAENRYNRLPALAVELARRDVAVIVTNTTPTVLAAKAATRTIPIVFQVGADPVELGLVASLNRPGGNLTGVSLLSADLAAKRLELAHELAPAATSMALLVNPNNAYNETETRLAQAAARALHLDLLVLNARNQNEIQEAFETLMKHGAGALMVSGEGIFSNQPAQLIALAARHAVPTIYQFRTSTTAGGFMSYGPDNRDAFRQVGVYAGRILKGEKPADLPVQQSVKIELVINLKTAKALGIDVPTSILLRADEVIE